MRAREGSSMRMLLSRRCACWQRRHCRSRRAQAQSRRRSRPQRSRRKAARALRRLCGLGREGVRAFRRYARRDRSRRRICRASTSSRSSAARLTSRNCSPSSTRFRRPQLSPDEQVNAAVFRTVLENAIGDARFRRGRCRSTATAPSGPISIRAAAVRRRRRISALHRADARHPALFRRADRQHASRARSAGSACRGRRSTGRDASIATFIVDDPAKSGFYKPFKTMPSNIPPAEQQALRTEAQTASGSR